MVDRAPNSERTSDDRSYSVTVLGGECEHRWRGTVSVDENRHFVLARANGTCPDCGKNAGSVMFGGEEH
jgi:hypothetical protein